MPNTAKNTASHWNTTSDFTTATLTVGPYTAKVNVESTQKGDKTVKEAKWTVKLGRKNIASGSTRKLANSRTAASLAIADDLFQYVAEANAEDIADDTAAA